MEDPKLYAVILKTEQKKKKKKKKHAHNLAIYFLNYYLFKNDKSMSFCAFWGNSCNSVH